ncbi:MAG: hypothetical protein R3265_10520 [Hyphomonas sp.]|nr:hypothetical protein [Hyphomonas sp.]
MADTIRVQDTVLEQSEGARIVLISGSNSLFGVDAQVMTRKLGRPTVNFGTHADFTIRFHADRLRGKLEPGDIVVAPLEYIAYFREATTDFEQEQLLVWARLAKPQDLTGKLLVFRDVWGTPMETILSIGASRLLAEHQPLEFETTEALVDALKSRPHGVATNAKRRMTWKNLGLDGNIVLPKRTWQKVRDVYKESVEDKYITDPDAVFSKNFGEEIEYLRKVVERQGAKLYLTSPNSMVMQSGEESLARRRRLNERLPDELAVHGIEFICDPEASYLPVNYYLDTDYHPNAWGAAFRAIQLSKCLQGVMGKGTQETSALANAKAFEIARARREVVRARYDFEKPVYDLVRITEALFEYEADHGAFPQSTNWDGYVSNWGRSGGELWIDGLAPDYIKALPRDRRQVLAPNQQYLYKSDGKDFKLLSHDPVDCNMISKVEPGLIDPKRSCKAIGFWTQGAKAW